MSPQPAEGDPHTTPGRWPAVLASVRGAGARAGSAAADWWAQDIFGGRASGDPEPSARKIREGIADGDPMILDQLPAFIGSELADEMPADLEIVDDLDVQWQTLSSEQHEQALLAYAEGFDQAVIDRVEQLCDELIVNDQDFDNDRVSVGDPVTMRSRLLAAMCETCIFRPGNPMHLAPGALRDLVEAARNSERYIVCHNTLPGMAAAGVKPAICRGFTDRYDTQALQVIRHMFGFDEIQPAKPAQANT